MQYCPFNGKDEADICSLSGLSRPRSIHNILAHLCQERLYLAYDRHFDFVYWQLQGTNNDHDNDNDNDTDDNNNDNNNNNNNNNTISLSSLCKIIWRHWTYKMPVRYILSNVWVRLIIFSQLSNIQSIIQYVGLCVFRLPTPLLTMERISIYIYILCLIIIIKSEVWTIIHCLGLGHETMVCAVCLSIFLITITITSLLIQLRVFLSWLYSIW